VMVVLMLFAIAMAGVTGYQVVSSEFGLAQQSRNGQAALAVARAGLQRFLGEQIGQVGDSVSYAILDGIATVTAQKVMQADSLNHLYYIRSTGSVADDRTPALPAQRTVGTYAWHRLSPLKHKAAFWVSGGTFKVGAATYITGSDYCGLRPATGGVAYAGSLSGTVYGSPASVPYASYAAMYDTVGLRWDVLSSESFPVDFDGSPPSWGSLPADSFPIVRYRGNLDAYSSWSGRGVLIVTGRLRFGTAFEWHGVILAGSMDAVVGTYVSTYPPWVEGLVIAGLSGANASFSLNQGTYRYDACEVYKANRALSYLEVVNNTLFEVNK